MKSSRLLSILVLGVALCATPAFAQRGGGGRSGGSSSSSHSSSSSRGGSYSGGGHSSSYSGSSRGSSYSGSSRSSSSYSGSSRSSSSSYSGSSRSSSSYSGASRGSYSAPSTSSSSSRSSADSYTPSARSYGGSTGSSSSRGSVGAPSRSSSVPDAVRRSQTSRSNSGMSTRGYSRSSEGTKNGPGHEYRGDASRPTSAVPSNGRPTGAPAPSNGGYARPDHPGGHMPPSHRPMHPAPYFHHPIHHGMIHCHMLYWDPCCIHHWHWHGFWGYCNSYWYDYHVSDVVVVRNYVRNTYKLDLVTYAMGGEYLYCIVNDVDGRTYLQVYDKSDNLLAEQKINRRYCKMQIDPQNGGCWIMKKRDKDPLLFLYADGQLLIYEAD